MNDDDDDDDDVFATSLIDQYAARPQSLNNICVMVFCVMGSVTEPKDQVRQAVFTVFTV